MIFNLAVCLLFVITATKTAVSQDCALFTRDEIQTLLSSTVLTSDPNAVCLASGTQKDRYRAASVFVTYTSNGSGEQAKQFELTCSGSGQWQNPVVSEPAANASTALRKDCGNCVANSNNDPAFDNITRCVPCLDSCKGLRQCTAFTVSGCCNFYVNDTCAVQCPAGTGADASTAYTCVDPCSSNPCTNDGTCSPELTNGVSFSCLCVGSWRGSTCESCGVADCKVCSQTTGVCSECKEGFEELSGACVCPLLCQNGERLVDQCLCNCSAGYSGANCEVGGPQCKVDNCQTCSPNYSNICEACLGGYQQDEDGGLCLTEKSVSPLSLGAVIGIALGAVAALLLCVLIVVGSYCCCCKKGRTTFV